MGVPKNKIELLAPAGSPSVLEAVIEAGCDSVYIGGRRFGMRQHARWLNFSRDEMSKGVQYAQARNVKVYVTVNNLLSDTEIGLAKAYLQFLDKIAPDAVLIQDLGLLNLARELNFKVALHASTMMNVHNPYGAKFLKRAGISRIVCSRDITLNEAAQIRRDAGVEVEVFLHNDICISQGSLCYLSGIATEKSSNRGLCIKPCRWAWDLVDMRTGKQIDTAAGPYLLAKKDLCLFHQIPELITAGIDAVKIEGRARPAEYLVPIIRAYRRAIDQYYADPYGYATDFKAFDEIRSQRIRDYTANYNFGNFGTNACEPSGKREPRFFSLAAEEKPMDASLKSVFAEPESGESPGKPPVLAVRCSSCDAACRALESGADRVYVGGEFFRRDHGNPWSAPELENLVHLAESKGKSVAAASPRIMGQRECFEFSRLLDLAGRLGIRTILVSNPGALEFAREHLPADTTAYTADFTFNLFNGNAVEFLEQNGLQCATLSPELPWTQAAGILRGHSLPLELVVHGSLFGMIIETCLISGFIGHTSKSDPCRGYCARRDYALRDVLGKQRKMAADQYCRNHLLMEKDLCLLDVLNHVVRQGADVLRIEGQFYTAGTLAQIVGLYRKYLDRLHDVTEESAFDIEETDLRLLNQISPRALGYGAYVNTPVAVGMPGEQLPTNELYLSDI